MFIQNEFLISIHCHAWTAYENVIYGPLYNSTWEHFFTDQKKWTWKLVGRQAPMPPIFHMRKRNRNQLLICCIIALSVLTNMKIHFAA